MNLVLDPAVLKFETTTRAESYDAWVKEKVQTSLDDPRLKIAHDVLIPKARVLHDSKTKHRALN